MQYLSNIPDNEAGAIIKVIEQFQTTWNKKDAKAMVSLFSDDAEFTDIMGQIARGKDQIEQMHAFVFEKVMKTAQLSMHNFYLRNISEDLVLVTCKWHTEFHTDFDGKEMPKRGGVMQIICRNTGSNREITLVYNTDLTPSYVESGQHELKFLG